MLKHRGAKIDTKHIVQLTQSENEYQTSGRVITGSQKIIAEKAGL